MILPSRLIKRLVGIVLAELNDPDPFRKKKTGRECAHGRNIERRALYLPDRNGPEVSCSSTIAEARWSLDYTELERFFRLATFHDLWDGKHCPTPETLQE
jgi:hypothetical protein